MSDDEREECPELIPITSSNNDNKDEVSGNVRGRVPVTIVTGFLGRITVETLL